MAGRRVAVIGAGVSGLAAIKSCLEEGLEPVAFERDSAIGGLWHYTDENDPQRVCVYDDVKLNSTQILMVYSDFPHQDKTDPLFVGHRSFLKYLNQYADHFDLKRHIRLGVEVVKVEPCEEQNNEVTKWRVQWEKCSSEERKTEVFDGVMVCTGLESTPFIPSIPGLDEFKGPVVPSGYYRTHDRFVDKRILVVGMGNSGAELSSFISKKASQVYLSTNHGAWLLPRMWMFNLPYEYFFFNRFLTTVLPPWLWNPIISGYCRSYADNDALGIMPTYNLGDVIETICEDLKHQVAYGKVKLKPGVMNIKSTSVQFKDDSLEDIDGILLATGCVKRFPYLPKYLQPWTDEMIFGCYLNTFLPDPRYRSLGFVGIVKATGPLLPMAELQARAYTSALIGRARLPLPAVMKQWIERETSSLDRTWYPEKKGAFNTAQWIPVMDDVAEFFGAKPEPFKLLFSDFQLAKALLMNMPVPAAYRLKGPHKWSGARETVIRSDQDLHRLMSSMYHGRSYLDVVMGGAVKILVIMVATLLLLAVFFVLLLRQYYHY